MSACVQYFRVHRLRFYRLTVVTVTDQLRPIMFFPTATSTFVYHSYIYPAFYFFKAKFRWKDLRWQVSRFKLQSLNCTWSAYCIFIERIQWPNSIDDRSCMNKYEETLMLRFNNLCCIIDRFGKSSFVCFRRCRFAWYSNWLRGSPFQKEVKLYDWLIITR